MTSMEILRGYGRLRSKFGQLFLGLAVVILSVTLGINTAQFLSIAPSLPTVIIEYFPSVVVASILLYGLLALHAQGSILPSLHVPRWNTRLFILFLPVFLGVVFLIGLTTVVTISNWGLTLGFPVLIVVIALIVVYCLAWYRVVDALALYFAIWPVLTIIRISIAFEKEPGFYQSVLIVPFRIQAEHLRGTSAPVAESAWGQLSLLSPEALFVSVILVGWVSSWSRGAVGGLTRTPLDWAIVVLLGAGLISALLSSAVVFSSIWYIGEFVVPICLFYAVVSTVRSEEDLFRVLWGLLGGLAIISGYQVFAAFQAFSSEQMGFQLSSIGTFSRFSPAVGNPNVAGSILVYMLPVAFAIIVREKGGGLGKSITFSVIVLTIVSILLSASRGPLLAMVLVFLGFFWLVPRSRPLMLLAGCIMSVALIPFLQVFYAFVIQVRPSFSAPIMEEMGVLSRIYIWQKSVEVLADHPVVGIGPGMFPTLEIVYPHTSFLFESAHQIFLNIGVETGLIGFAAFLAIVFLVVWHILRRIRSLEASSHKRSLQIVALGLFAFVVTSVTTGVPFNTQWGLATGLLPWTLAGLCLGVRLNTR